MVFDFDDTLAKSDAQVHVSNSATGIESQLSASEYAVYKEQPGDTFDFKEFDSILKNPQEISRTMSVLKKVMQNPTNKVTILTARSMGYPLKHFFKTEHGIDPYVVPVGTSDPLVKAKFIEDHIKKGYTDIFFIDDSLKNVNAVKALKKKYPDVNLKVKHAK